MKKKGAPELYEVLKRGSVDITKSYKKEEPEPALKEEDTVGGEPKPLPLSDSAKPATEGFYPRLKASFIKTKKIAGSKTQEKELILSYNTIIFLVLIIIILLAASFVIGVQIGENNKDDFVKPKKDMVETPVISDPINTPSVPVASSTEWAISVVSYDNNAVGKYSANRRVEYLKRKGIAKAYFSKDVRDPAQISVYIGPYYSKQEAANALKSFRNRYPSIIINNEVVNTRR